MDLCTIPGVNAICGAAQSAAGSAVTAFLVSITAMVSDGVATLMRGMWALFETTTFVDITSGSFTSVYNIVFGVAVTVMLGFFLLQVITGMIHREPAALSRAALGLGKSVLGSFVVVTIIAAGLEITDRICTGIIAAAGTNLTEVGDRITLLTTGTAATMSGGVGGILIVTLLLSILAGCAALILWISLLIRKALILIAVVFAPIALAGASWDSTRGWLGRWANFVVALVISKIVIVVFLLLATAQLTAPVSADLASLSDPITGVVLLLIAGFAPYLTYKAINFMGFDMYHAMSAEQEAKQALNRPVPVPSKLLNRSEPSRILADPGTGSVPPPTARTGSSPWPTNPGPTTTAPAGATGAGWAPEAASGVAASAGAAAGAGAGAGAAGAAGPVGAGVLAAKAAAEAGPKAGTWIAGQAHHGADAAQQGGTR
ncbi:conjugal transfer protein TrbL [Xylanimonas protaetiae]|uniref:Conjugal transfer protein TrbL n=1 Tax=Xylanimonas protaetiae TaxID=2509457 RepID=A0A4P6EZT0_9MICO|nr:conjugal transfer protein TrbL [Xylanimonas protaetiae]QAY68634.1 conjugal transfer protein TrbL [Xylanimonas protaetiae]